MKNKINEMLLMFNNTHIEELIQVYTIIAISTGDYQDAYFVDELINAYMLKQQKESRV